jgi:hypothetical protein
VIIILKKEGYLIFEEPKLFVGLLQMMCHKMGRYIIANESIPINRPNAH